MASAFINGEMKNCENLQNKKHKYVYKRKRGKNIDLYSTSDKTTLEVIFDQQHSNQQACLIRKTMEA